MTSWNWLKGGLLLGILSVVAIGLVKPLGVSTQYVILDGMLLKFLSPEIIEENSYLAKYASKLTPLGYGFILVIGMFLGALLSRLTGGPQVSHSEKQRPTMWRETFGNPPASRYLQAFIGGFLLLFGARLAGGCTSGHMVAGISQLSVSGLIFGAAVMGTGIITAKILYRHQEGDS